MASPAVLLPLLLGFPSLPGLQEDEGHLGLLGRIAVGGEEDSWLNGAMLSGDWGGWRDRMAERGFALTAALITDTSWPLSGGNRQRTTTRALFDLALEVDLERAFGWANATAFAEFYSLSGRDATEDVGDIQVFSNIDNPEHLSQLAELWIEQTSADRSLRVKAGKLDANSEFAHVDAGFEFIHSSAGFSPTIFVFPTYPDPAVSLNAFARPFPGWHAGLGIYNAEDGAAVSGARGFTAEFEEAFLIGQVERKWRTVGSLGEGLLAFGAWHHTGDFERFDGGNESGTGGAYAILEQRLTREQGPDDPQGLIGFLQWGNADGDVSEFEEHWAAGFVYAGLLPEYDTWHTGLYLSRAELTEAPGAGLGGDELAIELFQELVVTPALVLRPDLQWIVDPSGREDVDDVWVFTLRLELVL